MKQILLMLLLQLLGATRAKLQDENLTIPDLIKFWGYPVESHVVVTEDEYILTVHRIPYGISAMNDTNAKRPVIFLQHGLLCSSSNWVVNLPHQSLGFLLADAGYDVWMGNVRGNNYSKKHKKYKISEWKFWDFSFEEHAQYDLPAMVDYALATTGQKQLYYVGHSQGTMMAFAKLSQDKAFQKKIKVFFALAPVARFRYMYGPLKVMATFESTFKIIFGLFKIRNFLPSADSIQWFAKTACPFHPHLCNRITFVTSSYGLENFNKSRRAIYLDHTPAGTSVKNMYHFMQLVQEERFQKYDYGYWKNFKKYGSISPEVYDLKQIDNDIVLFSGERDWLAHPKDVKWLLGQLPSVIEKVEVPNYNHLDFVWGLNAREEIYEKIISIVRRFEKKKSTR